MSDAHSADSVSADDSTSNSSSIGPDSPAALALAMALMAITGIADSAGWLLGDHVWTVNQTGNLVTLGLVIAGIENVHWVGPVIALIGFCIGAGFAGVILAKAKTGWNVAQTACIALVGVIYLVLASLYATQIVTTEEHGLLITGIMAVSMGILSSTMLRLGVKWLTSVGVTTNLVLIAQQFRQRGKRIVEPRRILAVLLVLVGATIGALAYRISDWFSVGLPGFALLAISAVSFSYFRRQKDGN